MTPSGSPTATPSFAPSMTPSVAPSTSPTHTPSTTPTDQPSTSPSMAPSRTSQLKHQHFVNKFVDVLGSDGTLDEILVSFQDYCGTECNSLENDVAYVLQYGMNVPGFGNLYTSVSGTPHPTFAPTMTEAPTTSTTPAPTVPCASFPVDIEVAVWL